MALTYFKRFRMELDLQSPLSFSVPPLPDEYQLLPWGEGLLREHAEAKYASFHSEMDSNVFPCLGRRDGCLHLMREISRRATFVPESTWLLRHVPAGGRSAAVGTVQGIQTDNWGALQNLGVARGHRGLGLGTILLAQAIDGFRRSGLRRMHLEVTSDNTAAVRLYKRLGFHNAKTVFKATEVAGA
ncbi:GNAT family N-acetyltransferase [Planctomycetaceae bacterium SH139]